jgi:hypothetical protein
VAVLFLPSKRLRKIWIRSTQSFKRNRIKQPLNKYHHEQRQTNDKRQKETGQSVEQKSAI